MSAPLKGHDRKGSQQILTKIDNDEEEDPLEKMIQKTGCAKYHYAVQDCMIEHKDWRKCQNEVKNFQQCIQDFNKQHVVSENMAS